MKKLVLTAFLACLSWAAMAQTSNENKKPTVDAEFERAFMPGGGYGVYIPKAKDSLGVLQGALVEFLFFSKVAQNDISGPSHVRVFGKLNILKSDKKNVSDFLLYSVGLDMSLERNPKRNYFIPYFGLELGGLSNKAFGSTLQFTPMVGVHLVSRQNLFLNVQAGYIYPVKNFEMLQGTNLQAGLNFSFW
jgi:hypothetical protein